MKPYTGYEPQETRPGTAHMATYVSGSGSGAGGTPTAADYSRWVDYSNMLLIVAGWATTQLVLSPVHEYPIIDDWIYARSAQVMYQTGQFFMHPNTQANLLGLVVWGTLWCKLFGFSFTTLTYSTLVLALVGLLAFYSIARRLGVPPSGALLGTALFWFNPITLHLSYSFMTDVPFLSLVLMSCHLYMRGLQSGSRGAMWAWLTAGGCFAGWAFTIRQFGVLVPVAFALYLVLDGLLRATGPRSSVTVPSSMLLSAFLRYEQMLAIVAVPVLTMVAWWLWRHGAPPTTAELMAGGLRSRFLFKESWPRVFLIRLFIFLPITALSAWAAVKLPGSRWWVVVLTGIAVIWGMYAVELPGESWVQMYEPPFTARLGPFAVTFPQQSFTFGGIGNIVRIDGIDFFEYTQQPVWSPEAWRGLWALGVALGIVLLAAMACSLYDRVRGLIRGWKLRREGEAHRSLSLVSPAVAVYLLGMMTVVASAALLGDVFDRYMFHFLPYVILFVVSGCVRWGRAAWAYSLTTLALIVAFTLLAEADYSDHADARWQAAQWVYERTGGLHMGYDWDNWVGNRNDAYQIADLPLAGYRVDRQFPYYSRLGGFTSRYVLAQSRLDVPPLPSSP
jgi:hypothetical protein